MARMPSLEIRVRGEMNLGEELTLERISALDDPPKKRGPRRIGSTLSPSDAVAPSPLPTGNMEYLDERHELRSTPRVLNLKDTGLVLQYGIIGKPGCGKTHLLMHLLRQVIAHKSRDPERKYGGLILDPKAALIDEVTEAFEKAGRRDDLIVVNTGELAGKPGLNVIDCMLAPGDLAQTLVLAATSAGLGAHDPFWIQQMTAALGAILTLMPVRPPHRTPTLGRLMQLAVDTDAQGRPALDNFLEEAEVALNGSAAAKAAVSDFRTAVARLRSHAGSAAGADPKVRLTVEQFMQQAFGVFQAEKYQCYSREAPRASFYDQILEKGKVVLVSTAQHEVELTSLLPTLVKLIFQRTVISRFDRYLHFELHNCVRPVLFMADEYHTVATKVPGKFGDSEFFSLGRQFGALSFVATQSLQQLVVSSLKDAWKAIFDVLSAVIMMSGNDPETKKYVDELAGKKVVIVRKRAPSLSEGKESIGVSYERMELPVIPEGTLQMLTKGQAIVIGKIGGQDEPASVRYVKVPRKKEE